MTWFQNPFNADYYGVWVIDDRAHQPTFDCRKNTGRGDEMVTAWSEPVGNSPRTYNLSGNDSDGNPKNTLNLMIAMDSSFLNWTRISVDLTASATAKVADIVTDLNTADNFSSLFLASILKFPKQVYPDRIVITQKFPATRMRFYVENGGAESVFRFNAKAGVAELPTYFERHIVFNRDSSGAIAFTDGVNLLIKLDPQASGGSSFIDDEIISQAVDAKGNSLNYDNSVTQPDWKLVRGLTNAFTFTIYSNAEADETISCIIFPAGARAGDLAKQVITERASNIVLREFVMPYTLTSADVAIVPPAI